MEQEQQVPTYAQPCCEVFQGLVVVVAGGVASIYVLQLALAGRTFGLLQVPHVCLGQTQAAWAMGSCCPGTHALHVSIIMMSVAADLSFIGVVASSWPPLDAAQL